MEADVIMSVRQAKRVQEIDTYDLGADTGRVQTLHDDCLATFGNVCEEAYSQGRLVWLEEKVLDSEGTLEVTSLRLVHGELVESFHAHKYERTLS